MKGARTCRPRITANLVVPEVNMLAVMRRSSGLAAMEPSPVLVPKRSTKRTGAVGEVLEKSESSDVTT